MSLRALTRSQMSGNHDDVAPNARPSTTTSCAGPGCSAPGLWQRCRVSSMSGARTLTYALMLLAQVVAPPVAVRGQQRRNWSIRAS
jgi:hypothetical protein